jgi:hypothetical protein
MPKDVWFGMRLLDRTDPKQKPIKPFFGIGKTQRFCQFSSPIVHSSGNMIFLANVHPHNQGGIMDLIHFFVSVKIHFEYLLGENERSVRAPDTLYTTGGTLSFSKPIFNHYRNACSSRREEKTL